MSLSRLKVCPTLRVLGSDGCVPRFIGKSGGWSPHITLKRWLWGVSVYGDSVEFQTQRSTIYSEIVKSVLLCYRDGLLDVDRYNTDLVASSTELGIQTLVE